MGGVRNMVRIFRGPGLRRSVRDIPSSRRSESEVSKPLKKKKAEKQDDPWP